MANWAKLGLNIKMKEYSEIGEAQRWRCAICSDPHGSWIPDLKRKLAVDHDHATGRVRGLLCVNCNTALGKLQESEELLRRAIAYLQKHGLANRRARGEMQAGAQHVDP